VSTREQSFKLRRRGTTTRRQRENKRLWKSRRKPLRKKYKKVAVKVFDNHTLDFLPFLGESDMLEFVLKIY
jgi:hypothetical protein